jgi:hypothetical protein
MVPVAAHSPSSARLRFVIKTKEVPMRNLSGFLILAGALALGATESAAAIVRNDGYSGKPGPTHPLLRIRLRPDNTKSGKERPLQVAGGVFLRDAGPSKQQD